MYIYVYKYTNIHNIYVYYVYIYIQIYIIYNIHTLCVYIYIFIDSYRQNIMSAFLLAQAVCVTASLSVGFGVESCLVLVV